jgi:transposase IS4-like protein
VLAGPVSQTPVAGGLPGGLLTDLLGGAGVEQTVARAGQVDTRKRVLTGVVTVLTVLGLRLLRSQGNDSVLARVLPLLPGVSAPGASVPTGSALSQARTRVHEDVFEALFQASADAAP